MLTYKKIFFAMILLFSFIYITQEIAEARRFGGGRSFGGRASSSRSFSSPSRTAPQNTAGMNQNRGLLGGMGGLFGGLLAGTLLGSLLGGGGFGGFGIMDLLIFGGIAFILFRLFRRNKNTQQTYNYSTPEGNNSSNQNATLWGALGGNREEEVEEERNTHDAYPADFNPEEFLKGAKILFTRMQESWGSRNLEDIATFTSARVFQEVEQQAKEDTNPERINVIHVQAEITKVQDSGNERIVDVVFTAVLQEGSNASNTDVLEAWHFIRSTESNNKWILDGIAQV